MHRLSCRLLFACLTLPLVVHVGYGQDTTRVAVDSTEISTVITTPTERTTQVRRLGYYVAKVTDPIPFLINAGRSVIDVPQGRVPYAIGALRGTNPLLVVDGVPFHYELANFANLNAHEFSDITISGSPAAAFLYGGDSGNGSFFLNSKTGKDVRHPVVEVNSYTTLSKDNVSWDGVHDRWSHNNSVAFQQDFGAVDTRLSYNFRTRPYASNGHGRNHNIRLNTGADIAKGLSARIAFDYAHAGDDYSPPYIGSMTVENEFLQGNLIVAYEIIPGLNISSRNAISTVSRFSSTTQSESNIDHNRRFHNFIASFARQFSKNFEMKAFAGYTIDRFKDERKYKATNYQEENVSSNNSNGFLTGVETAFWNLLSLSYNFKSEAPTLYPDDTKFDSHSLSGSFIFSEAFALSGNTFSMGKIRVSYTDAAFGTSSLFPFIPQNPSFPRPWTAVPRKTTEYGADLLFFNSRIGLSASYFRNQDEETFFTPAPGVGTGGFVSTANRKTTGWEISLHGAGIRTKNVRLETWINWWMRRDIIENIPGFVTQEQTTNNFLGGPYHNRYGTFLNQLVYKKLFLSVLLDFNREERAFLMPGGASLTFRNVRYANLQDLSLGATLLQSKDRRFINNCNVAISARNLARLYDDTDESLINPLAFDRPKIISLSVALGF